MIPPPGVPFVENMQPNIALPILAEMYYRATGDRAFFQQHPEIKQCIDAIISELLKLKDPNNWLFLGEEVSDGHTVNQYDFINNLQVWRAFRAVSQLLAEVFDSPNEAQNYMRIAELVRQDVFSKMTVEGEFGEQFAAGTDLHG